MAEYIDREALISKFKRLILGAKSLIDREVVDEICAVIETFPTADVAEIKHGEWIYSAETINTKSGYFCSACKYPMWHSPDVPQAFKYCPNCGAKMDGKEKE